MPKILLVDDEELVRELIEETLSFAESYQFLAAESGAAALALLDQEPDLVLLDINLGGDLDGLDVCKRIRARERPPEVIFLTGMAHGEDIEAGMQAGAKAYLTKPFSPMELIDRIQEILGS